MSDAKPVPGLPFMDLKALLANATVISKSRIKPPPPVSAEEMNRPFGPADGSGDWSRATVTTAVALEPVTKYTRLDGQGGDL